MPETWLPGIIQSQESCSLAVQNATGSGRRPSNKISSLSRDLSERVSASLQVGVLVAWSLGVVSPIYKSQGSHPQTTNTNYKSKGCLRVCLKMGTSKVPVAQQKASRWPLHASHHPPRPLGVTYDRTLPLCPLHNATSLAANVPSCKHETRWSLQEKTGPGAFRQIPCWWAGLAFQQSNTAVAKCSYPSESDAKSTLMSFAIRLCC